jgi:hypothetical protein
VTSLSLRRVSVAGAHLNGSMRSAIHAWRSVELVECSLFVPYRRREWAAAYAAGRVSRLRRLGILSDHGFFKAVCARVIRADRRRQERRPRRSGGRQGMTLRRRSNGYAHILLVGSLAIRGLSSCSPTV